MKPDTSTLDIESRPHEWVLCWAMLTGLWHHQHHPIAIKSHGRRAKCLFRYGCDFLRRTCCDLALGSAEFDQVLQLLSLS